MGLFSGIGHFFKGILNGVKSAFKFVGKVLNSKIGRIVMIAAGVFTAGVALAAGVAAFAASSGGFLSSVVSGGQAFVGALAHPIAAAASDVANGMEATGSALAAGAGANVGAVASAANSAASGLSESDAADLDTAITAQGGGGAADSAAASSAGAATGPGVAPAADTATAGANNGLMQTAGGYNVNTPGGLLSQGAKAAGGNSFTINMPQESALSKFGPAALQVGGQMASGYASGQAQEQMQEKALAQENYYSQLWNPSAKYTGNVGGGGVIGAAAAAPSAVNPGYLSMAQNINNFMGNKAGGTPSFGAPNVQPGAPTTTNVSPIQQSGPAKPTTTGA